MNLCKFWTIAVVSNPVRYHSRYKLFERFKETFPDYGNLLVVELAFGDRHFRVTEENNPHHLQLRSFDELWHKENMINLGVQYLSQIAPDWEYVAWVDADVEFTRPDILQETWHKLQHHHFVQMFQTAVDLGPDEQALKTHNSFAWNYSRGVEDKGANGYGYGYVGHPGYAWAARREALDFVGGLIDQAILGSGDHHMALGLIGRIEASFPQTVSAGYKFTLKAWQEKAERHIRRDIGYVPGTILHHWHGRKRDRNYIGRWDVLTQNSFDPLTDIKRDTQGLWQLDPDRVCLRDAIRRYMASRNEDSIDLE